MDDLTKSKSADRHRNEQVLSEPVRTETMVLSPVRRLDLLGRILAEQIHYREMSRALGKMDLSPEEEEVIERLSYSLVTKLLLGPISEIMVRAEIRIFHKGHGVDRNVSTSKAHRERSCTRNEQMI